MGPVSRTELLLRFLEVSANRKGIGLIGPHFLGGKLNRPAKEEERDAIDICHLLSTICKPIYSMVKG